MSKTQETKDVFGIYEDSLDSSFATMNKVTPRFHQSITDLQQQCMQTCENAIRAFISTQKEFTTKAGINSSIPDAALNVLKDTTEQVNKAYSLQSQIVQTSIDTTKQNIKTYNDNAKTFADLNKNIIQSWITVFTQKN